MQITNCHCECSHLNYDECRLHIEQWMWDSFYQDNHIKIPVHKTKFAFMLYVSFLMTVVLHGCKYISLLQCMMVKHTHTHTHTPVYASHQKFSWRWFQYITNFVHFSLSTSSLCCLTLLISKLFSCVELA